MNFTSGIPRGVGVMYRSEDINITPGPRALKKLTRWCAHGEWGREFDIISGCHVACVQTSPKELGDVCTQRSCHVIGVGEFDTVWEGWEEFEQLASISCYTLHGSWSKFVGLYKTTWIIYVSKYIKIIFPKNKYIYVPLLIFALYVLEVGAFDRWVRVCGVHQAWKPYLEYPNYDR